MKHIIKTFIALATCSAAFGQSDTLSNLPVKIHHAEPLFIDLIRDLGARKGEKELNLGWGMEDQKGFVANTGFFEYEFSPVNRLGLEVEVPFSFYKPEFERQDGESAPRNRMEGVKLASQYTFLVAQKYNLSMAIGYIHEFKTHSFYSLRHGSAPLKGHSLNPFFVAAKRWGKRIHSMIYTGPEWEFTSGDRNPEKYFQVNASTHYQLNNGGNLIGVEVNQEYSGWEFATVVRPQVKLMITSNLALGLVTGIPVNLDDHGISFMARIIFEPPKRK
ncbi:phosphoribosylformylglycinamidine synthase [Dyadobacter sp. CY345]|uniref:HAEPLYID family protein n=1 Tax=Dyadobacter sp. CY345 TaxID=2909335 RepID=UPI001F2E46F8|nr:HAEPLYID family protein [Dyadobacter sp. CY345]MCF2444102.1 phosphoribosylformylglycinamidine synthase [Dyadobacter sp. CY345]